MALGLAPAKAARPWEPVCIARCACLPPVYVGTKLYCLVTEENVCEQLVQVHTRQCRGLDRAHNLGSLIHQPNHYATYKYLTNYAKNQT